MTMLPYWISAILQRAGNLFDCCQEWVAAAAFQCDGPLWRVRPLILNQITLRVDALMNMILDRADQAVHAGIAALSLIDRRWKRGVQVFQIMWREC